MLFRSLLAALVGAAHAALALYAGVLLVRLRAILREPKARMLTAFLAIGSWHAVIAAADVVASTAPDPVHGGATLVTGVVLLRIVHRTAVSSRTWTADPIPDPIL